jgi:HEPN domain-containing protein
MTERPEIRHAVGLWVQRAEEDLTAAEHMLTIQEDCPFGIVCFHAQQCAEKYLKALLTFHSIRFPKTHDLSELALLLKERADLDVTLPDLAGLGGYAVEARYPGDWDPIERADAKVAVAIAARVRGRVRSLLPREFLPAGPRRGA